MRPGDISRFESKRSRREIDFLHRANMQRRLGNDPPKGADCMEHLHGAGNHLGQ